MGTFSEESRQILFASFEANPLPDRQKLFYNRKKNLRKDFCLVLITFQSDVRRELAVRLNRTPDSIKYWFKDERRRARKRQAELRVEPVSVLPAQAEITAEVVDFTVWNTTNITRKLRNPKSRTRKSTKY